MTALRASWRRSKLRTDLIERGTALGIAVVVGGSLVATLDAMGLIR